MSNQILCSECGQLIEASATFCTFCGANRRQQMPVAPASPVAPNLSDPGLYQQPSSPPPTVNPLHTAYPAQPLYQPPNSAQPPYPSQPYPAGGPNNVAGAPALSYPQQQTGVDSGTIALAVLGFCLALVSLLFVPIFAGAGAIACGIKVRKKADVLGIVILVVAIICMVIGIVFGVIVGLSLFANRH